MWLFIKKCETPAQVLTVIRANFHLKVITSLHHSVWSPPGRFLRKPWWLWWSPTCTKPRLTRMFVPALKLQYCAMKRLTCLLPSQLINKCIASGVKTKALEKIMKTECMKSTRVILVTYNSSNRRWLSRNCQCKLIAVKAAERSCGFYTDPETDDFSLVIRIGLQDGRMFSVP